MLVLTRKNNEEIFIGDNIKIKLIRVRGNSVRIGIDAPREVRVVRGELESQPAAADSNDGSARDVASDAVPQLGSAHAGSAHAGSAHASSAHAGETGPVRAGESRIGRLLGDQPQRVAAEPRQTVLVGRIRRGSTGATADFAAGPLTSFLSPR